MAYYTLPSTTISGAIVYLPNCYRPGRAIDCKIVCHNLNEPDALIIDRLKLREMANYGDGQLIIAPNGRTGIDGSGLYAFDYWNLAGADIDRVMAMRATMISRGVTIRRTTGIGYSNGAFLVRQIRDRYPSFFNNVVLFNGGLVGTNDLNTPGTAVPGILLNAVDDTTVLPAGQDPAIDLPAPLTNHGGVNTAPGPNTGYKSVANSIVSMCTANGIASGAMTNYGVPIQLVSTDGGATQRAREAASTNSTAVERWTMPSPAAHAISVVANGWRNFIEPWCQVNYR